MDTKRKIHDRYKIDLLVDFSEMEGSTFFYWDKWDK